jgi:uncharacterized membrane protein YvbJ
MVYCTKCGAKNPDDAKVCSQCGSPLKAVGDREYYRHMEDECFGIPHGAAVVGVAIGALILLWGFILILQELNIVPAAVNWWPIALIIVGILFIIGAISRMARRRR